MLPLSSVWRVVFFFFFKFYLFSFLVVLDLCCFAWAFSSCSKWGLLFIVGYGLLIAVASLVAGKRLWSVQASVVVAHGLSSCGPGLSCSTPCGIFPDQGLNLCNLHCKADFYPLYQLGGCFC